ncbi:MAG: hypothetical protein WCV73_00800 [Patescibacteria group bacterium]|jgi:hypothetical protein
MKERDMERNAALHLVEIGGLSNNELLRLGSQSGDQYVWAAVANKLDLKGLTNDELLELKGKTFNQPVWRAIARALKQ